jgi:lysophospholipase L1-like esterase
MTTQLKPIVAFGDSITVSVPARANRGYPSFVDGWAYSDGFCVLNAAASGVGFQPMRDTYDAYYAHRNIWGAFLLIGVNNIANGDSATTTFNGINSFIQAMLLNNIQVAVSTILPWKDSGGWTSGKQTITETVNSQILALNGTARGLLALDGYSVFGDDTDSALLARKYQESTPDGIHLGQYGSETLAQLFYTALRGLHVWNLATQAETATLPRFGSTYGWPQ